MKSLKIIPTKSNGSFSILKLDEELCSLRYKGWLSRTAEASLGEHSIKIEAKGFWGTRFVIFRDGNEVGAIKNDWKNNILISFTGMDSAHYDFVFKSKGFWQQRFIVLGQKHSEILIAYPHFIWKKFRYEYDVELVDDTLKPSVLIELLLYTGYAINHHKMMTAAAASAGS